MADLRQTLVFEVKDGELVVHKQNIKAVRGETDKLGKTASTTGGKMSKMFAAAKAAFVASGIAAVLTSISKKIFTIGSAAEETASKFNTVFGDSATALDKQLNSFNRLAGLTKTAGRDMTATFGAIIQGAGGSQEESAKLGIELTKLAGDFASFNNISLDQAGTAIRAGLTGETEPLKRLGVVLRAAEVDARALADTGKKTAKELNELERATARVALITEKAGVQVGDLERTSNSTANTARRLQGAWARMGETIAVAVLPVFGDLLTILDDLNESLGTADDEKGFLQSGFETVAKQVRTVIAFIRMIGPASKIGWLSFKSAALSAIADTIRGMESLFNSMPEKIRDALRGAVSGIIGQQLPDGESVLGHIAGDLDNDSAEIAAKMKKLNEEFRDQFAAIFADIYADLPEGASEAGKKAGGEYVSQFVQGLSKLKAASDSAKPFQLIEGPELPDLKEFKVATDDILNNLADMGRTLLNSAGLFGALTDEARELGRSILDAVDNIGNLRGALRNNVSGLELAIPTIGVAVGGLSALQALGSALDSSRKSTRELQRTLAESTKRLEASMMDLIRSNLARSIEGRQPATALGIIRGAGFELGNLGGVIVEISRFMTDLFETLRGLNIEGFPIDDFWTTFINTFSLEGAEAAWDEVFGPTGLAVKWLETAGESIGDFGQSVQGAADEFRFGKEFLDISGLSGAQSFAQSLLDKVGPDLGPAIKEFLEKAAGGGFDTIEALQEAWRGLAEDFFNMSSTERQVFLEGLTAEELDIIGRIFNGLDTDVLNLSDAIGDAIDSLRLFARFITDDVNAQNRFFIDNILAGEDDVVSGGGGVEGEGERDGVILQSGANNIPPWLQDLLEEGRGLDLTTAEGQARFQEIIKAIATAILEGRDFGGLTPEQVEDLLFGLDGILDFAIRTQEDTDSPRRSIFRGVTEITANELALLANERNFILRDILDAITISDGFSSGASVVFNNNIATIELYQRENVNQLAEELWQILQEQRGF